MSKVGNVKKEVSATKDLNDMDILNHTLQILKDIGNNYNLAAGEMSSKKLYKELLSFHKEAKELAREVYDLAFKKGWYTLEAAEEKKIKQLYDEANKQKKELS